ncbi:MAG: hypothetical protein K5876_04425 [Ruminiclostridium sp.]|nr:hypothetical protein [Ruminiclostridium sp.]
MKELLETGLADDLGYYDVCDALVGRINGLSVAVKENSATSSYGCLIWVCPDGSDEKGSVGDYLAKLAEEKPHIIKHYRAAGRGAAIALVKYNDSGRNIGNINKLMSEIAAGLAERSYSNCCYRCGSHEQLSIYSDNGVPVQYCSKCGRGTVLRSYGGKTVPAKADPVISEDDAELGDLLIGQSSDSGEAESVTADTPVRDDNIDLSGLLFDGGVEESSEPEERRSELFEALQKEYEEEQRAARDANGNGADDLLDSLLFEAGEKKPEETPREAPAARKTAESNDDDLGGLLFDGTEEAPAEEKAAEETGAAANADIGSLMYDGAEDNATEAPQEWEPEMQAPAALGNDIDEFMVGEDTEVTAVTAIGRGEGEDIVVDTPEEEYVGEDENIAVTEIYDDSNEGENIDIEELDPEANSFDNSGEEIEADDTPLEADGSVPLVNPSSNFADIRPSSAFGPGAVRAYSAGSYDNATATDEPVGFDGRPKSAGRVSDPRAGDEMGSRSRDYTSQRVAEANYHKRKTVEAHRVSGVAKSSSKSNYSYIVSNGSHTLVGSIAAFLFGLVGVGLWAGIGYILDMTGAFNDETSSLISAVCAFLPALFVFVGFRIGGDCFDRKGIVISAVMSLLLDGVGAFALFVTSELRWTAREYGYSVSMDAALERVGKGISGENSEVAIYGRLLIIAIIAVIALAAAIVIANKRSEQ